VDQLVVVGASAGGIEALSILVGSLPADLPAPVVIAQHLDPSHPSHLADILGRKSALPVRSVEGVEALLPATVYVVPSNRHVEINDHHVTVHSDATRRPTPSVDLLLATAADVFGERLVAVILTGSGSDGAAGAHAVKEVGGTVLIQDPATAAFPSMPRALAAPLVDAIVPLNDIGPFLGDLLAAAPAGDNSTDPDLPALLAAVRERHGIDFSAYKAPTIERRLRRRIAIAGVKTVGAYQEYLETHPDEEEHLVADFLIKVTSFFRDPALFARLGEVVLPELIEDAAADGRELRLWSAGCATGEEAYSLALLVAELLAARRDPPVVRIFATDVDQSALAFARLGVYPMTALANVPPDLIAHHFIEHNGTYEARKEMRSLLVFGHHDLAQRPPFPNTDLIVCRNVLIYFTPALQRRALDIFAYSLRHGGYLVLGKSETALPMGNALSVVDRTLRIYQRQAQGTQPHLPLARMPVTVEAIARPKKLHSRSPAAPESAWQQPRGESRNTMEVGARAEELLRRLPIGIVVIDRDYDIVTLNGVARELLGVHGLAIGQDLIHLAQRVPSSALRSAIDTVVREGTPQRLPEIITVETATGDPRHLAISCHPDRRMPDTSVGTVLIVVEDVTTLVLTRHEGDAAEVRAKRLAEANQQLLTANRELADALERMREQAEDLRLSTEAAQVAAEEIETLNEELLATNEELETLHEEAQASLEELNVANDELQARGAEAEELAAIHAAERSRLAAVLASMADAVIVVDRTGQPVLTNAAYDEMVGALGDRFVPNNARGWPMPGESTPPARAARGEEFRLEFMVPSHEGKMRWFEATARPLQEDDVGAAVIVIRDITDRSVRQLQAEFLDWAGHELRTPLTALQSYLQLAARRLQADGDARLRTYIERAVGQAKRQAKLIDELLDATRLETGRLNLRIAPLDLAELAKHAVEVAQVLAEGQKIMLEAEDRAIMVAGDRSRLEQVLLNLLTNAIAYAPATDRIEMTVHCAGEEAVLTVRDFGPGIGPAQQDTIFERLAQGDSRKPSSTHGLGLGLFISREIVRQHGGTIDVGSSPGGGATFAIRLPLLRPEIDATGEEGTP
jgi:two-component system CheB/CheR fusion protein